jgi:chloramphenicol 3-O-phosphotransferase
MSSIILLSGPVGAGKSTVARELVATATGLTVRIEGDVFWSFIVKGAESLPRQKHFVTNVWAMTAAALPYSRAGYETIVDFSIPLWLVDRLRARFTDISFEYVVLRPAIEVCAARAAGRTEGRIEDYTPYKSFYAEFDAAKPNLVCDDAADPATLAALIREALDEGRFRLPPPL